MGGKEDGEGEGEEGDGEEAVKKGAEIVGAC
jgi:hypothetical protein